MFRFVIVIDPGGYFTWRFEGPPIRGNSPVLAVAPQSWAYKASVLEEVKKMKTNMFTAIIVDNTPAM